VGVAHRHVRGRESRTFHRHRALWRLDPRSWTRPDGERRIALESNGVELVYGAKSRGGHGGDSKIKAINEIPAWVSH
jgi:hypothetical protein